MSQVTIPEFPNLPDFNPEDVASLVLISIAMEEMGLSHILNAEGEKIQWILGTLGEGSTPAPAEVTVEDVLDINQSVRDTLEAVVAKNLLLHMKAGRVVRFFEAATEAAGVAPAKPAPAPAQP
ncbi:hypothetical protein [Polyangium mundeleinium]|uniref:Uncharacterized protein n=1 Tax=Polyangium mundeleinium TaxID=2995306 RepID=A0ABT5F214_9BACT|nr:hypothetical protein [Polyangium mundeleinium]MDC0748133.1 hypothetical protein [Polyangium mundeleinium]